VFSGQGAMVEEDMGRGRSRELSPGGIPKGMVVVRGREGMVKGAY
jgi:hypothetical protein